MTCGLVGAEAPFPAAAWVGDETCERPGATGRFCYFVDALWRGPGSARPWRCDLDRGRAMRAVQPFLWKRR